MTERAYITVNRAESPRVIQVADVGGGGADELVIQDLHDTLNSNTLPAGDPDDSLDNMDDDFLIDSVGKATLGPGLETGITATLQNAQLAFEGNYTPAEVGTATSADVNGTVLTDTSALFETNGVERGAVLLNWDDRSASEVLRVISENVIEHRPLQGGNNNDWEIGDAYSVYNVIQKTVSQGNLVAVDGIGDPLNAIFPTFATQVIVALDTSASAVPTAGLTPTQQEIRDAMTIARSGGAPAANSVDQLLDDNPANVVAALGDAEYDGTKYSDIIQDLLAMASGDIIEDPVGTFTVYERDGVTPRYVFIKSANKRERQP
jgi:hypothetical protein